MSCFCCMGKKQEVACRGGRSQDLQSLHGPAEGRTEGCMSNKEAVRGLRHGHGGPERGCEEGGRQ